MHKEKSSSARFIEIISILRKHKIQEGMNPVKFREILEDLGPTFVKIGQIMSTRQDMFSERYSKELVKLRSNVTSMPYEDVNDAMIQAFGTDWHSIFPVFEKEPLGSASIAQVHAAQLRTGEKVVVKVQRPHIYEIMERDLKLLRRAARFLNLSDIVSSVVDVDMVLDEFWTTAKEEMDFTIEAHFAKRFKETYKNISYIDAPVIYDQYTSRYVLVMEYVDGIDISQADVLDKAGYDRKDLARKLAYNYISQIIENGFFHADPHSGNLRVRQKQIVWIDFGMMGTLDVREREIMKTAVRAIAMKDTMTVVDCILALGQTKKEIDYANFTIEIERFMQTYINLSFSEIDVARMIQDVFTICHEYRIQLPKGVSMLARSMMTIETTLMDLDPTTNMMEIASEQWGSFKQIDFGKEIKRTIKRSVEAMDRSLDIPVQTSDIFKMIKRGQIKVNMNVMGSEQPIAKLDHMVNRIIICVLIAALLIGSSLLCMTTMEPTILGIPALGFFGFVAALGMSLWLFVKMLILHRHNKLF